MVELETTDLLGLGNPELPIIWFQAQEVFQNFCPEWTQIKVAIVHRVSVSRKNVPQTVEIIPKLISIFQRGGSTPHNWTPLNLWGGVQPSIISDSCTGFPMLPFGRWTHLDISLTGWQQKRPTSSCRPNVLLLVVPYRPLCCEHRATIHFSAPTQSILRQKIKHNAYNIYTNI